MTKETTESEWVLRQDAPGFWSTQRLLKLIGGFILILFLALSVLFLQQNAIRAQQVAGQERGYINRAQTCKVQVALGLTLDDDCLDPNVVRDSSGDPRYNPNAQPVAGANSAGQEANRRLLCTVLAILEAESPDCTDQ